MPRMFKCECCGKVLPETREYFVWFKSKDEHGQWHRNTCRKCEENKILEDNKKILENGTVLYKCHICGEWLTSDHFSLHDTSTNTYAYRDHLDKRCNKCKSEQNKKARSNYDDSTKLDKILQHRFLGAKDRAKRNGLEFNLTKEVLKSMWESQNGMCAITKIPMTYTLDDGRTFTNVSIDKIDPNKGYVQDNIQLVCMAVNQMKSDMTMDELYYFCEAALNNKSKENDKLI